MNQSLDLASVQALVVGLAREGTALTRFLVERGARVTVTDVKPAEALADNVSALADLSVPPARGGEAGGAVTYALGGHPLTLLEGMDILFVSPGVPLEMPLLAEARRRGLPLSSETRLFTRLCPAQIVGITGSSGKTTTTALVGEMLKAAGRKTWVGGNIGQPLIGQVDEITPGDMVIMELSSFQLEFFGDWGVLGAENQGIRKSGNRAGVLFEPAGWSPPVAAVLNVTPNHLDRHPSMEAYVAAKAHILNHQKPGDVTILNLDNPITRQLGDHASRKPAATVGPPRIVWFSLEQKVDEGAFLRGGDLVLRLAGQETTVCQTKDLKMMGQHNVANTLAACALAATVGVPVEALRRVATSFTGVEHRLELVRERGGVRWYNDSIATTPERTVAALKALDAPIVLLAGGRDKHLPWDEMAALTWQKVHHLVLFGEAAPLIEREMHASRLTHHASRTTHHAPRIHHAGTLERAVAIADTVANPGDVVLLSPGGTSFDAYRDFVERGEHFRKLVEALE